MANILKAILNFAKNKDISIVDHYRSKNKIQVTGDILEYYIKDLFCDSIHLSKEDKDRIYTHFFSYLGNTNNSPDFILKDSDAIEVKKLESTSSSIALNSSFPKNKLYNNDPLINKACRECEDKWIEKDLIYTIGNINKTNEIHSLWFLYGDCYAADYATYQKIKDFIANGINDIQGVEFSETQELGRINKVDPLEITYFRIRGMWGIEHPNKVFSYLEGLNNNILNSIILENKYMSFPEKNRQEIENSSIISIKNIEIKNPNNPAQLLKAKHIFIGKL
ncbi:MAG: NgoPII family restriction endonuclease [Spirochaetota bacterium]|nr:NgoPII family restriction endonuclease [Spirochaetota bacterium]